ncbi:MAG TPA: DUF4403 family protein [Gemmatimonadales bacterium]|nr:DUF4403 family protein [Gemmatimonadales bacterium]
MATSMLQRCALGVGLCAAAACRGEEVAPPVPTATGIWVDTLPPVPTSYLDVPVRYDLGPAMRWLEREVPTTLGDLEERQAVPGKKRLHYAYAVRRSPFRLQVDGRTAVLQAEVRYRVRAWYNPPVLPEISASCDDDETPPRARLTVATTVQLTSGWTLRPRTRAVVAPLSNPERDRCKVTFLRVDITDKVMGAAQTALQHRLTSLDARIAAFDLPDESRRLWGVLGSPLKLTDSLWLVINPSTIRLGMLRMQGDTLISTVGLSANPRIVGGPRPDVRPTPMPAPQDSTSRPPVMHLLTEGRLPYDVASSILTKELRGTIIRVARQRLVLDSLHLIGVGDGRVAVGLAVHGSARGVLYAVGHPAYDTTTAELYMPDLEYDVRTRDLMTGTLAWLAGGPVEEFLRTKVRIKLAPTLADGQELLERNLNRDLAEGVHLRMDVRSGRVLSVRGAPSALLVRAVASGQGELVLDLRPEELVGHESLGAGVRSGSGAAARAP